MTTRIYAALVMLCASIILGGCSSTQLGKLEGQWELFYIDHLDDENIYVWEFGEGNSFTITSYSPPTPVNPTPVPNVICSGQYTSSAQFVDAVIRLHDFQSAAGASFQQLSMSEYQSYDQDWKILKIDNEVLRLGSDDIQGQPGGYIVREFTRVN